MSTQSGVAGSPKPPIEDEKHAATIIQAQYKGFKVRQEVKKEKEAATKIQAAFRGHQVRKEPKNETDSNHSDDIK
ncbi:unnamed protein product [Sphagnum balticum]